MSKINNKLIWGLPICILVCIALILGFIFGYRYYLLRNAKTDLFSCDDKRMGPAFAYLLKQGDKGLKIIEDFCRKNSETGWGPEIGGLRLKVGLKDNIFASQSTDKNILLGFELKNTSDNKIQIARSDHTNRNFKYNWEFVILPDGKIDKMEYDFEMGGGIYGKCDILPGEKITTKISDHFRPGLYYNASFWGIFGGINHAPPISNKVTFVILP